MSPFTSKFDAFLAGNAALTADEMAGYDLFRGKANCNSCHLDGRSMAPSTKSAPSGVDTGAATDVHPLFTCGGYANLGLRSIPEWRCSTKRARIRLGLFRIHWDLVTETWD